MEMDERQTVKLILDDTGLSHRWLIKRLRKKEVSVEPGTLSAALSGLRTGKAQQELIRLCLEELQLYLCRMEQEENGVKEVN